MKHTWIAGALVAMSGGMLLWATGCAEVANADATTAEVVAGATVEATQAVSAATTDTTTADALTTTDDESGTPELMRGAGGCPEDPLGLTDEQLAAAQEIFDAAHTDIEALREAEQAAFEALLTEEQLALLDELPPPPPHGRQGPPPPPPPMDPNEAADPNNAPDPNMPAPCPPPLPYCGTQMPEPPEMDGLPPEIAQLADLLGLTDEQITAWTTLRADTRTQIEARKDQACTDFRALLTEEQLATLDELPPPPPPMHGGPGGHGGHGGPGGHSGPGGHGGPDDAELGGVF